MAAAARNLETRAGVESFALIDGHGRIHGHRRAMRAPSASLLKAMALVSYLNLGVGAEPGPQGVRPRLFGPMIRRSDNATASTVLRRVGARRLYRLAERAEMQAFRFSWPIWGHSTTSAQDRARFFYRIDRLVPRRHRGYALWLLAHIVRSQRGGSPVSFRRAGRSTSRAAGDPARAGHPSVCAPADGETRLSLSILTRWNPSHRYGTRTIRGVAARLLRE
jgi:Beta-lactamase enzyme family